MKKLLTLVAAAGMMTFLACGPSAEDQAAQDKAREDSMKAAEAAMKAAEEAAMAAPAPMDSAAAPADTAAAAQ